VSHLHYFCEKLDELASFFTMLQGYIEEMDSARVDPFSTMANTTKQLSDRAKAETSEEKREKREKVKRRKLDVRGIPFAFSCTSTCTKLTSASRTFDSGLSN
jgi:hypothetical protein